MYDRLKPVRTEVGWETAAAGGVIVGELYMTADGLLAVSFDPNFTKLLSRESIEDICASVRDYLMREKGF